MTTWQIGENAFIDADGPYQLIENLPERERCNMKKKRLESQLAYQQARYLKGSEALERLEQRLSETEAELQELRAAYEDQIPSDRITQGWITSDDLGSGFAELTRKLGFTPPYVFGMEHDKETGEIIILTGLKEKRDGLLYVVRTEVNE